MGRYVLLLLLAACLIRPIRLRAQDNYEIQVYGAETLAPKHTMVELHSNFTFSGTKQTIDGVLPTEHSFHETIEITHGFTPWFETGLYIFTSASKRDGFNWVGDHIRPRVRAPEAWKWPVGASISFEFGYQRSQFSANTWTLEIRPIVDKQIDRWYVAFNPTMDRAFHGPDVKRGFEFSPNAKVGYDVTKKVNVGVEYYGSLGPLTGFDPIHEQQQQIIPAVDLNLGPNWEFNAGLGVGITQGTDRLIFKMIVGRRFAFGSRGSKPGPGL
ncbi:MAG: transporter [Acidobacteriota bacterium]|nr:transporter [Acidobacteriota bacterium]